MRIIARKRMNVCDAKMLLIMSCSLLCEFVSRVKWKYLVTSKVRAGAKDLLHIFQITPWCQLVCTRLHCGRAICSRNDCCFDNFSCHPVCPCSRLLWYLWLWSLFWFLWTSLLFHSFSSYWSSRSLLFLYVFFSRCSLFVRSVYSTSVVFAVNTSIITGVETRFCGHLNRSYRYHSEL